LSGLNVSPPGGIGVAKVETAHDALTYKIIGLAMALHNELGPGFPEEMYQKAMCIMMAEAEIQFDREFQIDIIFHAQTLGAFRLDFVVERNVVLELKALENLHPLHEEQVISYLAASGLEVGLLINFGSTSLQHKRIFPPEAVQYAPSFKARRAQLQTRQA
jgi:GxxExxY protein